MSTKLSQKKRTEIRERLLDSRFGDDDKWTAEEESQIAGAVWEAAFADTTRRKLQSTPYDWLPQTKEIMFGFQGRIIRYVLNETDGPLPVPYASRPSGGPNRCLMTVDPNSNLGRRIEALESHRRETRDKKAELSAQIQGVFAAISTAKQLKEAWPEISDVVDEVCRTGQPSKHLPARKIQHLNAELGLCPQPHDQNEGAANVERAIESI